jgi:hypothetical protein
MIAAPPLDKEMQRLEKGVRESEQRLEQVREERWHLEDRSEALSERRRTEAEAFRLAGRIDQALELFRSTAEDSALAQAVADLIVQATQLRQIANAALERVRLSGAIQRFTQSAHRYAEALRLERADDPIELNVDDLMISVLQGAERRDALWEIGSAENHVGYHLTSLLALHEDFLGLKECPVPSFLMIDQPSQAYFPDRWPGDEGTDAEPLDSQSEDIAGVRRIFETLALAIARCKGRLQIIVTDHAGEITWHGVPHINVVGNWRNGQDEFLIPQAWIAASTEV